MTSARFRFVVRGAVQGVGFRPFVWRLAHELGLGGHVRNEGGCVVIEAEGERVDEFRSRLHRDQPAGAHVEDIGWERIPALGEPGFVIEDSQAGSTSAVVPDMATCADCLREVFDPTSRFHRYAFTNCTRCGPRYSIVERTPYDRVRTTMAAFGMCAACRAEYENPADRRFHAQPTACPACGPRLSLCNATGEAIDADDVIDRAAAALGDGQIVALKGLGGFQLLADARNERAVTRLRERKHRPHKPLAVMMPDVEAARRWANVDDREAALLQSPAAPIVLLTSRSGVVPAAIAPGLGEVGLMLPTTALHHLLLRAVGCPVVCTSGNLSGEPICTDNEEALARLAGIADVFLMHDRPIRRAVDDSVARVIDDAPQVLRLARGYAPLTLPMPGFPAMATGAHLKNSLAVRVGGRAILSQHIGDLESTLSIDAMRTTARDLQAFFGVEPVWVACDLHPDYASTHFAQALGAPVAPVPHHVAHALACMAEHGRSRLLAVVWDGTGLGPDGTLWGGEFLVMNGSHWRRAAHLRPFGLPGGDRAARDARRALAGLRGDGSLTAPVSTSAGRLFDAFAALLGLCGAQTYEGQAAMRLEAATAKGVDAAYDLPLVEGQLDWRPMLEAASNEQVAGVAAAKFQNALAEGIVAVAREARETVVALTGGCFQNRYLTERVMRRLREEGFTPVIPRRVPPNDGGIALGQLAAVTGGRDVPRSAGPD
jgi:hydrogenase maturation protein HypF